MIRGDSADYELLKKWSAGFDCNGNYSCEIGVREGMGSKIIMDLVENNYMHIGVDPYGDRQYQHFDDDSKFQWPNLEPGKGPTYPDSMRDQMLHDFRYYSDKFHFANMTDTEFMANDHYSNLKYAFVFLDGPHTTKDVLLEGIWFAQRAANKTRIVFDDYGYYNMKLISDALKYFGFSILGGGENKVCMEKNGN